MGKAQQRFSSCYVKISQHKGLAMACLFMWVKRRKKETKRNKTICHRNIHLFYSKNLSDESCFFFALSLPVLALIWVATSSCSWEKNVLEDIDFLPFFSWKTSQQQNMGNHTCKKGDETQK